LIMKLVLILLNRIELLEDLLTAFLEIGVSGATVLDSVGMGHIISTNVPIFAGLQDAFAGSSPGNKTILAVVEEKMVETIAEVFEDICSDPDESHPGIIISIPIDKIFGLNNLND
jgi:nitrogen regulatory protein P-II 1